MSAWQMFLTTASMLVGAAMVLTVLYVYATKHVFHAIGGSLMIVFGAAIVAFTGGAAVEFGAGGDKGAKAIVVWDHNRDKGRVDANTEILSTILAEVRKLAEKAGVSAAEAVTKAVEDKVVDAAAQAGAAPKIEETAMNAAASDCGQSNGTPTATLIGAKYEAFRTAVAGGNATVIGTAAQNLSQSIDKDPNAQKCWTALRTELKLQPAFEQGLGKAAQLSFALKPLFR